MDDIKTDVLMCVGPADVDYLFLHSLTSCVRHLRTLRQIVIVTPDRARVKSRLQLAGATHARIEILEDSEVLSPELAALPGWCRQQLIKLQADKICGTRYIVCLGADTIFLREVIDVDLFVDGIPILYYNRHFAKKTHLHYERERVRNIARILGVEPIRSLTPGDFIMDCAVFDSTVLRLLRTHLRSRFGSELPLRILPVKCSTLEEKKQFGEWTLYAVFLLDVQSASPPLCNSNSKHLAQVHSNKELQQFDFTSRIAHFVDKGLDSVFMHKKLLELGIDGCFEKL